MQRSSWLVAFLLGIFCVHAAVAAPTRIRFTLDWKFQGVHAWYYLALKKGYFAQEGLDVQIDQGEGSAATVPRIMTGTYDAGFGDINAIIQNAGLHPGEAPVMVYMIYNNAPFVLAAMKDGPIKTIADLEGHSLGSPAGSAALALMPTIESINHIDPKTVKIVNMAPNLLEQMLAKKQVDVGVTYNITTYMNLFAMHVDPETEVRWFYFKDFGIDLYSNGVMVSKALLRDKPDAVRGLVRAINHAIKDVAANPDEGIAAVAEREPLLDRKIEKLRMLYAFKTLMDTPEVKANGLGDVTDAKLASSIDLITKTFALPRRPESSEIFDRSFLPPKSERETTFPPS